MASSLANVLGAVSISANEPVCWSKVKRTDLIATGDFASVAGWKLKGPSLLFSGLVGVKYDVFADSMSSRWWGESEVGSKRRGERSTLGPGPSSGGGVGVRGGSGISGMEVAMV